MDDHAGDIADDLDLILASDDPAAPLSGAVTDAPLLRRLSTRLLWSFFSGYGKRLSTAWSARVAETALALLERRASTPYGRQWLLEMAFHGTLALSGTEAFHHNTARIEQALANLQRGGSSRSSHYVAGLLAYMRDDMHAAEGAFGAVLGVSGRPLLAHHAGCPAFRAPNFYRTLSTYTPPPRAIRYITHDTLPADTTTVVLCAADDVYFSAFADGFARQLFQVAPTACIHFHLINNAIPPDRLTRPGLLDDERIHLSTEQVAGTDLPTYTTMARYLLLPELLERWQRPILVSDIDMALMTDPVALDGDAAVTLAISPSRCAVHIPAVTVIAHQAHFLPSGAALEFARTMSRYLSYMHEARHAFWTVDQIALLVVWRMLRNSVPLRSFHTIPEYRYRSSADRSLEKDAAKGRIAASVRDG